MKWSVKTGLGWQDQCSSPHKHEEKITKSKYLKIPPNCLRELWTSQLFFYLWDRSGKERTTSLTSQNLASECIDQGLMKSVNSPVGLGFSWFPSEGDGRDNDHEFLAMHWSASCCTRHFTSVMWTSMDWEKTKRNLITSWSGILVFFYSIFIIYSTGVDTKKNCLLFSGEFEWS